MNLRSRSRALARTLAASSIALLARDLMAAPSALDEAISTWAAPRPSPSYRYAFSDLNGDGLQDAVVLITDLEYCGSGGCTMLVLKGIGRGFEFVSLSTITREPIYVLQRASSGWRAFSVLVSGGGVAAGQALLRFDGEPYPLNPSTQERATPADLNSATQLTFQ